ncbi:MAG: serine/threonine-protein kinase [Acidobacteriota bacterium]
MASTDWQQIEIVFQAALDVHESERAEWLTQHYGHDGELVREVESLLAAESKSSDFLSKSDLPKAVSFLLNESEASRTGQRLGPYKILKEIGRGGMGTVYLAERADEQFEKLVAIKLLRRGMDTEDIVRRFRTERQILASLEHPHIARLIDGGMTADGLPYFVLEYIEGKPLDQYCDEHKLPTAERLRLFRQVCAAVQYAHQNLIVHRDLKPSNILVTATGEPKLLDFGIAKLLNTDAPYTVAPTETQSRLMTPDYASPEQVRGRNITTASDVYSLGVVLYRLLSGHAPYRFAQLSALEIERLVCDTDPDRPSAAIHRVEEITTKEGATDITPESVSKSHNEQPDTLRRLLQGDLDNIVLMAMRKEPERRYQSAAQLADDILRYLEGRPINARANTFSYRAEKFLKRNRLGVAAALLVLLTLVGGMVATTWQARVAARQRDQARLEKARAEQLNTFLQTILSAAAPVERGHDAKVVDVIDDAALRIDTDFAAQPELRAQALLSIGNTYRTLGLPDKAEKMLREALKLNLELYGEENAATALSMIYLSDPLMTKRKESEAEPFLTKGVEIERRLLPSRNKDLAFGLRNLGELYTRKGAYEQAKAVLQESLSMYDEMLGANNPDSLTVLLFMARTKDLSGDAAGAEAMYREVIAAFRPMPKRYENRVALTLYNLGRLLTKERRYDEALSAIHEAENIYQKSGDASIYTFYGKCHLTKAYLESGNFAQAIVEAQASLDIGRKIRVDDSSDYAVQLQLLGLAFTRSNRAREGEGYLRQAVELAKTHLASGDINTPAIESALGECLMAQNKLGEAEPILIQSFERLKAIQGGKGLSLGFAAKRLVTLYEKFKKPELAAKYQPFLPENQK